MTMEWTLLWVAVVSALTVLMVLAGFWLAVIRPYLDSKVQLLIEAGAQIEPAVKKGVQEGVEETLRNLPEATLRESCRHARRFGSGLIENGLSSFLGDGPASSRKSSDD